ncbi:MAG: 50S ribosomal protein L24 [Candidatus Diapherotrites archaeon]|nr:50S ribosomal protein L24 [Candidatus Diapherotrites archaeon]
MDSKQPGKKRKSFFWAKMHTVQKFFGAHLNKELRKSLKKRSLSVRKGDKVKIVRGKNSGKIGKIMQVNRKKVQVFVEGLTRKKSNGKEVFVPFHPSNLEIVELAPADKKRIVSTLAPAKESGKKIPKKEIQKVPAEFAAGERKQASATKGGTKAPANFAAEVK